MYYFIYIYIEHDFLQVVAVLSHTRTFCPKDKKTKTKNETTALLVTFQIFFFKRMHNTFHVIYLYSVTGRVKYHVIYKLI